MLQLKVCKNKHTQVYILDFFVLSPWTPFLKSHHWFKIHEKVKYKVLSLTYKSLKTGQPSTSALFYHSLHIVLLGLLLLSPIVALLSPLVLKLPVFVC